MHGTNKQRTQRAANLSDYVSQKGLLPIINFTAVACTQLSCHQHEPRPRAGRGAAARRARRSGRRTVDVRTSTSAQFVTSFSQSIVEASMVTILSLPSTVTYTVTLLARTVRYALLYASGGACATARDLARACPRAGLGIARRMWHHAGHSAHEHWSSSRCSRRHSTRRS